MDREEFQQLMAEEFDRCLELARSKNADYAKDEDALANFVAAAERLGTSPERIWAVYADKHWQAVMSFCAGGRLESEPIEARLRDMIVYSTLLLAMIREWGTVRRAEIRQGDRRKEVELRGGASENDRLKELEAERAELRKKHVERAERGLREARAAAKAAEDSDYRPDGHGCVERMHPVERAMEERF